MVGKATQSIQLKTKPLHFKETPPYMVKSVGPTTLTCSAHGFPQEMNGAFYDLYGNKIASQRRRTEDLFSIIATITRDGSYRCEIRYNSAKVDFVTTVNIFKREYSTIV